MNAGQAAAAEFALHHSASIARAAEAVRCSTLHSTPSSVEDPDRSDRSDSRGSETTVASGVCSDSTSSRLEHDAAPTGPASESLGVTFEAREGHRESGDLRGTSTGHLATSTSFTPGKDSVIPPWPSPPSPSPGPSEAGTHVGQSGGVAVTLKRAFKGLFSSHHRDGSTATETRSGFAQPPAGDAAAGAGTHFPELKPLIMPAKARVGSPSDSIATSTVTVPAVAAPTPGLMPGLAGRNVGLPAGSGSGTGAAVPDSRVAPSPAEGGLWGHLLAPLATYPGDGARRASLATVPVPVVPTEASYSQRSATERFSVGTVISPAVVIGTRWVGQHTAEAPDSRTPSFRTDCTCQRSMDDGEGWYKGRAGTSAYWCPEMLDRNDAGDRVAYGAEADWYSLGCTIYALFTGRSPFSSGLGASHDAALTLDGRVSWPRGIFSKEGEQGPGVAH